MNDDLRPCAHCGDPSPVQVGDDEHGYYVLCNLASCAIRTFKERTWAEAVKRWNTRAADAEIAALRAERDALRLSLDESVKELSRTVQQMNELNRSYAELKAHSTGNLTVTMRERDRLQQQIAALTAERDALRAALVAVTRAMPGCAALDDVSSIFLASVPGEVRAQIRKRDAQIDALTREPDEMELCVAANEALMAICSTPNSREACVKAARAILAAFIAGRRKS